MILVIFFMIFQLLEIEKKKFNYNEKKKIFWCKTNGLLPKYIVRKKKFVLQYSFCIVENEACRCLGCIAIGLHYVAR